MKTLNLFAGVVTAAFLFAPTASAGTSTTTFGVDATVANACSVSANALSFGAYDPVTAAAVNATTTVSVTCSNGAAYDVGLDAGTATGATVSARQMTDAGTNTLDYALYSDSARTVNWGATVGTDTVVGTGSGAAQALTVYGAVASGQTTAAIGSYSDTITVTVTY